MASPSKRRTVPLPLPDAGGTGAWWRYLFDEAEDVQLVCDTEGLVLEANRRAADQLGLGPDTHLLKGSLLAPPTAARLQDALASPARAPQTVAGIAVACPNGAC